jgi:NTP pyrophosphatase (non-canonical NTP hydrolase)
MTVINLFEKEVEQVQVDFGRYCEFVNEVTSNATKYTDKFVDRVNELGEQGVEIQRLLTAAVGITAEGGEFTEIVKKIAFQGKPFNDQNREHMIVELGDVMWYIAQACIALGVSFDDIAIRNVNKLSARYPEGTFEVFRSENRREGDI